MLGVHHIKQSNLCLKLNRLGPAWCMICKDENRQIKRKEIEIFLANENDIFV